MLSIILHASKRFKINLKRKLVNFLGHADMQIVDAG